MIRFLNESTGKINTIHFGSSSYSDFTTTNNERRKDLYHLRHSADNINDLAYPGAWSWHLLWARKTFEASIKDMERKFNIKVYKEY